MNEKLKDLWDDIIYYYPKRIKNLWISLKTFIRNTWRYRRILLNDNDFDFGYLEDIILQKLEFMAKYFRTARIVEGEEKYYEEINLCLKIGKIAFEKEEDFNEEKYINIRNSKRFIKVTLDEADPEHKTINLYKKYLRNLKARNLFYKIISERSNGWWD